MIPHLTMFLNYHKSYHESQIIKSKIIKSLSRDPLIGTSLIKMGDFQFRELFTDDLV